MANTPSSSRCQVLALLGCALHTGLSTGVVPLAPSLLWTSSAAQVNTSSESPSMLTYPLSMALSLCLFCLVLCGIRGALPERILFTTLPTGFLAAWLAPLSRACTQAP